MNKNSKLHNFALVMCGMVIVMAVATGVLINGGFILCDYNDSVQGVQEAERKTNVVEGDILDRWDNPIMAPLLPVKEEQVRVEPAYAHLLGYNSVSHGYDRLRGSYRKILYDDAGTGKGSTIKLTIDDKIQKAAYSYLQRGINGNPIRGSIVILDAKNGDVLAMTSRNLIEYDTSVIDIEENFKKYSSVENFFYNYPTDIPEAPGSVYKLVTACAAIEKGCDDHIYNDVASNGVYYVDGNENLEIKNHSAVRDTVFGDINMQLALNQSLNTYFASLGIEKLGESAIEEYAKKFLINIGKKSQTEFKTLDVGFAKLPSCMEFVSIDGNYNERYNLANLTFGQGEFAITPLHLAMIGQAIANNGDMKMPLLIKSVVYPDGKEIPAVRPDDPLEPIKAQTAQKLKDYLVGTTRTIFGKDLSFIDKNGSPVRVYSKTGTAEIGMKDGTCHAYLMCMTDDYVVLISSNRTKESGSSHKGIAEGLMRLLYE